MGNKLRINGVTFTGRTDISSWTTQQQPGGVRVDWGGGDIDILEGETWEVNEGCVIVSFSFQRQNNVLTGSLTFPPDATNPTVTIFSVARNTWTFSNCTKNKSRTATGGLISVSSSFTGSLLSPNCHPCVGPVASNCQTSTSIWQSYNKENQRTLGPSQYNPFLSGDITGVSQTITVTTNTGATSSRDNKNPSVTVLTNDCILTINYADGGSSTQTYAECPTVEAVGDEVCPQNCFIADKILGKVGG